LFDILLLDDEPILMKPYIQRRKTLDEIMYKGPESRMFISSHVDIDFARPEAEGTLLMTFHQSLNRGMEGLILKPLYAPYFPLLRYQLDEQTQYCIQFQKDYMPEFGGLRDAADMVIVGARYDEQIAKRANIRCELIVHFTTFYLGCLNNKQRVLAHGDRPCFEIVAVIHYGHCIPPLTFRQLNEGGKIQCVNYDQNDNSWQFGYSFDERQFPRMTTVFPEPYVAEILGEGYEKSPNAAYMMLRHPLIKKLHHDKTWSNSVDIVELGVLANESRNRDKHIAIQIAGNTSLLSSPSERVTSMVSYETSATPKLENVSSSLPLSVSSHVLRCLNYSSPTLDLQQMHDNTLLTLESSLLDDGYNRKRAPSKLESIGIKLSLNDKHQHPTTAPLLRKQTLYANQKSCSAISQVPSVKWFISIRRRLLEGSSQKRKQRSKVNNSNTKQRNGKALSAQSLLTKRPFENLFNEDKENSRSVYKHARR
jgi:hypothetical protein